MQTKVLNLKAPSLEFLSLSRVTVIRTGDPLGIMVALQGSQETVNAVSFYKREDALVIDGSMVCGELQVNLLVGSDCPSISADTVKQLVVREFDWLYNYSESRNRRL